MQQISSGTRPGFREELTKYGNTFGFAPLTNIPFLFGLYPGLTGYADGNVVDTTHTTYQLDGDPALNRQVLKVKATNTPTTDPTRTQLPDVAGDPRIPVVSLHDIDDLFVPFSMEQIYAGKAAANGRADLFVSRAIRGTGHCEFTTNELAAGFSALVDWVRHGTKPAGDRSWTRWRCGTAPSAASSPTPLRARTSSSARCPARLRRSRPGRPGPVAGGRHRTHTCGRCPGACGGHSSLVATLVIGFVVGLVFALWVSIGVRLVRRSADGSAFGHDLVVRAEAERGLRELQRYLARS